MKSRISLVAASCLLIPMVGTARSSPCVALGDSLTYAYEGEFGFQINVPFSDSIGDGFGPEVRNWVEILRDPAFRGDQFDFGARDEFTIEIPFVVSYDILFRHKTNWSLPGLRIFELRDFMEGTLTFEDLAAVDPILKLLLDHSNIDTKQAFEVTDMQDQIRHQAERLVLFIGGNDVRSIYGETYNGASPDAFIASFIADAAAILNIVHDLNSELPVVVVSVPHIGITPDIKRRYPTMEPGTGRVTAALRELNRQLKALADARGYGFADVFTPTLPLLSSAPFSVQGIQFINDGSVTGDLDYVWLNGELSANFHPNTHGQAIIANAIIEGFNTRYGDGIAPLTATEILGGLIGKAAAEIDMPFDVWMDSYGFGGLGPDEDADGDGIPAAVEFGLGLSPLLHDARMVTSALRDTPANGRVLELAYPLRLTSTARFSLSPAHSPDLASPFTAVPVALMPGSDGLARAWLNIATASRGFLRLECDLLPGP